MDDFVMNWVIPTILGLFGVLLAGLIWMLIHIAIFGDPARDQFMAGCIADRGAAKEYECQAMWRSGDRAAPMPMPIIVPVR